MKNSDNDFTLLPADQSSPAYTGAQAGAPEDKPVAKTRKWHGPALVFVTCVIVGITFSQWQRLVITLLAGDYSNAWPVFIYAFVGLGLTIALSVMTAILIRSNWLVFLISVIYAAMPYAVSSQSELKLYFIMASAVLVYSATFAIRNEAELLKKPSIRRFFKAGASRYFTAASLAVAFCAVVNFNSYFTTVEKLVPSTFFNIYFEEIYRYWSTGVTMPAGISNNEKNDVVILPQTNEKIDAYLERAAHQIWNRAMAEPIDKADKNATLDKVVTTAAVNATVAAMRSGLSQQIGIELTGQEQALFVLYRVFIVKADALMAKYREGMPVVAGVAAFALMRVLSLIAYIPVLIITSILMAVGQKYNLWKLEKETVTVERFRL